jgi:hypothetical protein
LNSLLETENKNLVGALGPFQELLLLLLIYLPILSLTHSVMSESIGDQPLSKAIVGLSNISLLVLLGLN